MSFAHSHSSSVADNCRHFAMMAGQKCPICFDFVSAYNAYVLECGHTYCLSCLFAWLSNRIKDREVQFDCFSDAPRPHTVGTLVCRVKLSDRDVQAILGNTDTYLKWIRFRRMLADPSLRDCPNCGALQSGSLESPDMVCVACGCAYCFLHATAHPDKPCATYAQERGSQEAADEAMVLRHSKRCPRCAAPTEKQEGCNSVRCGLCHATWCWLCCQVVDSSEMPTHFQWWNLGGCANKQFADGNENRVLTRLLTYAYFLFLGIPSFILTAVLYVACGCACIPASLWYEQGPAAFFMTMTSMVSLALATVLIVGIAGPLVLPFVLLYAVVMVLCAPCYLVGRRRQQRAAQGIVTSATPASTSSDGIRGVRISRSPSRGGMSSRREGLGTPTGVTMGVTTPTSMTTAVATAADTVRALQELREAINDVSITIAAVERAGLHLADRADPSSSFGLSMSSMPLSMPPLPLITMGGRVGGPQPTSSGIAGAPPAARRASNHPRSESSPADGDPEPEPAPFPSEAQAGEAVRGIDLARQRSQGARGASRRSSSSKGSTSTYKHTASARRMGTETSDLEPGLELPDIVLSIDPQAEGSQR